MSALVPAVLLGLIGLLFFMCGLTVGLLDVGEVALTITLVAFGLLLMSLSAGVWFELLPRPLLFALRFPKRSHRVLRQRPFGIVGVLDINNSQKGMQAHGMVFNTQVDPETTETLLKSMKGIPLLIQAIHFSLETTLLSGQSVIGTSVIHTAPGCSSVLDCDSRRRARVLIQSATPRLSSDPPEQQWENAEESNRWTNPQLNISLNRANSSLTVFPYSESRPLDDLSIAADTAAHSTDQINLAGSHHSGLSRAIQLFH
ncbi:hypothetical protein M3Y99_00077100 [Aphelenchoides fujianensis]|nr:hypothetical protein M3Y99_00077100 [Aphelenchoides fujianensis]